MSTSSKQLYSTLQEFHGRDDVECQISARLAAEDTIIALIGYTYKGDVNDTASFIRYGKGLRGYYEGLYTADGVTFFDDGVCLSKSP
jgi:hypothetical protein